MTTSKLEDRLYGLNRPYIDLTPANQWGGCIAAHVGKDSWASIQEFVAQRSNHTCELCNASPTTQGIMGKRANKFCIEMRFDHDETSKIATLRRLLHVCTPCSQSIHLRQTELVSEKMPANRSPLVGAIARLVKLHAITEADVKRWLATELATWDRRQKMNYPENIDVEIIEDGTNRLWR